MRTRIIVLVALALVAIAVPARAQESKCNDRAASIVLKSSAGTLVACDTLRMLDPAGRMRSQVTFSMQNADAADISSKLTELYGAKVVYVSANEGVPSDVEFHNGKLQGAFDMLSEHGRLTVNGLDYSVIRALREELSSGGVAGSFSGAKLSEVLAALSIVTGDDITASAKSGDKLVTLDFGAERLTLRDILQRLATSSHTAIGLRRHKE
jgi:hypothetical protein